MKITCYVKDKKYSIEVGDGTQSLQYASITRWLADVANFKYRREVTNSLSHPSIIRLENT